MPISWKQITLLAALLLAAVADCAEAPRRLRLGELDERRDDDCLVTVEGTVVEIANDEVDPEFTVLLLKDEVIELPVFVNGPFPRENLVDAHVRVTGRYYRLVHGVRRYSGPFIQLAPSGLTVLKTPPADRLDVPAIDPEEPLTPNDLAHMGRRSARGRVLATWGGNRLMLRVGTTTINVKLADGQPLPRSGQDVKVAGHLRTDLYWLNLIRAIWAPDTPTEVRIDPPEDLSPRNLWLSEDGKTKFNTEYHGWFIRFRGIVRSLPSEGSAARRLYLDADGHRIPVDFSSNPSAANGLEVDCGVEVTGCCLMETDSWHPQDVFPQIRNMVVVLRTPDDLRILSRPPWWTPARLLAVIAVLATLLLGFIVWNRILNRLVERRSRQLYRAELERASNRLKLSERTRLAVELHDTLSQNLTGIALEIGAGHHDRAQKCLKNCREELKNCLWDLRNNALEEAQMDEAIRRTLAPHLGDAHLTVRFNVPRARLSDSLAHAVLRIVRELAVNAVRHGHAHEIRIAGSLEQDKLLFSVRDDGCGFDPATAPGMDEGHFGLHGVRERVESMDGEMNITSAAGQGTKVVLSLVTKAT